MLLVFSEPVIPTAATAATAALVATAAVSLEYLQVTYDGQPAPQAATLTPVTPLPPAASIAIGSAAAAASAVAYRLSLNLDPPAAGGERLSVSLAADTLLGIYGGVVVPHTASTESMSDLRAPTFAGGTWLTPAATDMQFNYTTAYTVALLFSEPVLGAGGAPLTANAFQVSVTLGRCSLINGTFFLSLSPSPPSSPPSVPPSAPPSTPSDVRRALQSTAAQLVSEHPAAAASAAGVRTFILRLELIGSELPKGSEEVTITALPGRVFDLAGNPLEVATISAGNLDPAGIQAPSAPPLPPPGNATGPTTPEAIAIVAGVSAGVVLLLVLGGCLVLVCCGGAIRRWLEKRQRVRDAAALRVLLEFMDSIDEGKEGAARKLRTLKQVMATAAHRRLGLAQAAEEVLGEGSVLPPALSAALAAEYATRVGAGSVASDEEKLELLEELLRPPRPPEALLERARAHFADATGRPPATDAEALELMREALDPHLAANSWEEGVDEDLASAVEEVRTVDEGAHGGGGVRARPPLLKPVGDLKALPAAPGSFDMAGLPVAVIEAASAMFGHAAAPLVTDAAAEVKLKEDVSALRRRLDQILGPLGSSRPTLEEGGDGGAVETGGLPPTVLAAANDLFASRMGYAPTSEREALSLLREALHEAGVNASGQAKPHLQRVLEALPPPPPPMVHVNELPAAVVRMAEALEDVAPKAPPEVRQQQQLHALQKRVEAYLDLQKLPKLILSVARAQFEADEKRGASSDLEALDHMLDNLANAGMSEVAPGWDGGGGAGPVRPPLLGPSAGKSWELPPPPPQLDMRRVPAAATRAAESLGIAVARLDPQDRLAVLIGKLREHRRHMLPKEVLAEAHRDYIVAHDGKPAASDREALAQLGGCMDAAHATEVRSGWEGGGGARVLPPRPRPVLASDGQDGKAYPPERPLQLGTLPLSVVAAAQQAAKKSHRNLLAAVLGGLTGGGGGAQGDGERKEVREDLSARVKTEPAQLAAQLAKLRQRIDSALLDDPLDGTMRPANLDQLPRPVLEAAHAMFVARHGCSSPSEAEALSMLRDTLEHAGIKRDVIDATYGQPRVVGALGDRPQPSFGRFALPDGGLGFDQAVEAGGGRLDEVWQRDRRLLQAPPPLSSHLKRAAAELDGSASHDAAISHAFGYGGVDQGQATSAQLRQLRSQLDGFIAAVGGASQQLGASPVALLPPSIELALQGEFHMRLGGNDRAEGVELVQLAEELVREAKEAREALHSSGAPVLQEKHDGEKERPLLGAGFGASRRDLLPPPPPPHPPSLSRSFTRSLSRCGMSSKALARLPSFAGGGEFTIGPGGFQTVVRHDSSRGVNEKQATRRPHPQVEGAQHGRGSLAAAPVLLERDATLHHLGSRKELYSGAVRDAVKVLAKSASMQAAVQVAADAPSLVQQLSAHQEKQAEAAGIGSRVTALGKRIFFGRGRGRGGARVLPSSPQRGRPVAASASGASTADPSSKRPSGGTQNGTESFQNGFPPSSGSRPSTAGPAAVPPSQSTERIKAVGKAPLLAGWDGGGGARLPVLALPALGSARDSCGEASWANTAAVVRMRGRPSEGGGVSFAPDQRARLGVERGKPSCTLPAVAAAGGYGGSSEPDLLQARPSPPGSGINLGAALPITTPTGALVPPTLLRQCSSQQSMHRLPPLPPLRQSARNLPVGAVDGLTLSTLPPRMPSQPGTSMMQPPPPPSPHSMLQPTPPLMQRQLSMQRQVSLNGSGNAAMASTAASRLPTSTILLQRQMSSQRQLLQASRSPPRLPVAPSVMERQLSLSIARGAAASAPQPLRGSAPVLQRQLSLEAAHQAVTFDHPT